MKEFLLVVVILIVLAVVGWFAWSIWGAQLSHVPGQFSAVISRLLTGMMGSLASFGAGVRDSFHMPGR